MKTDGINSMLMKKYYISFCCVLASILTAVSCRIDSPSAISGNNVPMRVIAASDDTRSYIDNETILWGTGEYLKLWYNDGQDRFADSESSSADAAAGSSLAAFDFNISASPASSYALGGFYPASSCVGEDNVSASAYKVVLPQLQYATATSYDPAAYLMVVRPEIVDALPSQWTAWFGRATALNRLSLKGVREAVTSVEISVEGKDLAGGRYYNLTSGEAGAIYDGKSSVKVKYDTPLSAGDMDIWFTSWGIQLEEGGLMTVTVHGESNIYTKTIRASSKGISFLEEKLNTLGVDFSEVEPSALTIRDFARAYVGVLDIWQANTATINMITGEASNKDHTYDVPGAHYVPSGTTFTLGDKIYNTADMLETAERCYLLLRGYDGNYTASSGASAFSGHKLAGSTMSDTPIPATHNYEWGGSPYNEAGSTSVGNVVIGNGGYFKMGSPKTCDGVDLVKLNVLDNFAFRHTNYPISNGGSIANMCGYSAGQLSGYYGCFSAMRALITYAYFFRYMLDNNLEDATSISASQTFATDLFGLDLYTPNADARNAYWCRGDSMNTIPLGQLATNGIGTIFLNEAAITSYGAETVRAFIAKAAGFGIDVHIWMQVFYYGGWICPVDVENQCYNQTRFDEVINTARSYIDLGAKGIHFDYLRFPGTPTNKASLHNYKDGSVTGTGAITEFCRQANVVLKAAKSDIVLSAALMAEKSSSSYYGQIPSQMGQYMDVLVPMIYRYGNDSVVDKGSVWAADMAQYFVNNSGGAKVWPGIMTYKGENSVTGLTSEQLSADCRIFGGVDIGGIALFRYGLGGIPDLTNLWK